MTQKESKRKVQVWTHDEILSSHQNYQVTQVTMNIADHFVCSRLASKDYFHSRMSRYPNSVSTFHLIRLFVILKQVPLLKTVIVGLALALCFGVLPAHARDYTFRSFRILSSSGKPVGFCSTGNLHNSVVTLAKSTKV